MAPAKQGYDPRNHSLYLSERLRGLLLQSAEAPLTLFYGPSGCGKTAAMLQLEAPNSRTLLLNAAPCAPQVFWRFLCQLLAPGADPDGPLPLLAEAATTEGHRLVLLNDYQNVADPWLNERLLGLALCAPGRLRVAVAGRVCPWPAHSDAVCRGQVLAIGPEDMALDAAGCAALFRAHGQRLTGAEAQQVYQLTLGWPMALRQMLNERLRTGRLQMPTPFLRMLTEQVEALPAPLPAFLIWLAPAAEGFDLAQAAYLWRSADAAHLVDDLFARCFHLSMDTATGEYRFHPLVAQVLRQRLMAGSLRTQVFSRMALWHQQAGQPLAALHCFFRAEDTDSMLRLLESASVPGLMIEPPDVIETWYETCEPSQFYAHPYALIYFMWLFFLHGKKRLHGDAQLHFLTLLKDSAADPRRQARLQYAYQLYRLNSCLDLEELPQHCHALRANQVADNVRIADRLRPTLYGSPLAFGVMHSRHLATLTPEAAEEIGRECPPFTDGCLPSVMLVLQAESLFLRGFYDEARVAGHRAIRSAQQTGDWNSFLSARFLQAKFYFLRGRLDRVQDVMSALRRETVARCGETTSYLLTLELIDACFYVHSGQMNLIANWILEGDLSNPQLLAPAYPVVLSLHALTLLQRGLCSRVLGLEDALLTPDTSPLLQIYNLLVLCSAHERLHAPARANAYLQHAAAMAQPEGLIMPFVERYRFLQPVISRYTGTWKLLHRRIPELGARFSQQCAAEHPVKTGTNQGLTPRENQVAHLAAQGMYNREISQQLKISENTVKSALQSVYEKLGVNSRRALPGALGTGRTKL